MRLIHLFLCVAFGFLGVHRFIVGQKKHGLVFLLPAGLTIFWMTNPATEGLASISAIILMVFIIIDAITVLLTGRYIAFTNSKDTEGDAAAGREDTEYSKQKSNSAESLKTSSKKKTRGHSIVLIAYEINAQSAQQVLTKNLGRTFGSREVDPSAIIDHVAEVWTSITSITAKSQVEFENQLLYTCALENSLRIGQTPSSVINNSFLMSLISDEEGAANALLNEVRLSKFVGDAKFERKQFSFILMDLIDQFTKQEIGIFGWFKISSEHTDTILKKVATELPRSKQGELHFIEVTDTGQISPNFSNVQSQRFEGRLAGNLALSLSVDEYRSGLQRINEVTHATTGFEALPQIGRSNTKISESATNSSNTSNRKTYSNEFKKQVVSAANQDGATLASVGQQFDVSPTLVRNWKNKFSENTAETSMQDKSNSKDDVCINEIQLWLRSSQVEGTIDGDGELYVSLELSEEVITDKPKKIYLTGSQKLASGGKSETFDFESEVTTNESNWLRSDYLNGVDKDDPSFALNMKLACHVCSDLLTIPITVKEGKIGDFPDEIGNIQVSELNIILEDGDYRLEGRLNGEPGFIYGIDASTEEPDSEQSPRAAKVMDDENTVEVHEFLWDVKKGNTVYIQLSSYAKLDGEIAIGFTGKAEVQEPTSYNEDLDEDFDRPEVEDVEAQEGDIGLFEFQIKRGYVDEEAIEDDEVRELVSDLKSLCESEDFEAATKLLMQSLSFEFGPDELDDEPEKYFSDLDYIEFECTNENTSVKVGVDGEGDLLVTITVQFEIALNAGISTGELEAYLPDSGAWAAASASPGWGYYESDGENIRFLGLKGEGGSNNHGSAPKSECSPDNFEGTVHAITIKRSDQISDFGCLSASNHSMDGPELTIYLVNDLNTEDYHLILEGESYYLASVEEFDWEAPKYALSNIQKKLQQTFSINDEQAEQLIFYIQANVTDEADDLDAAHFTHFLAECGEVNGEDHFKDEKDATNRIWISTGQNLSGVDVNIDAENFSVQFDHEFLEEKEVASWSEFKLTAEIAAAYEMTVSKPISIMDLSSQPIGSMEFKIEVASACAESGMNYKDFAKLYNLNADELNSWAIEFLGSELE